MTQTRAKLDEREKKNSQEGKAHPTFQPMTKLYIINYVMNLLPLYVTPGR